jgi:hypothetical protein
MRIARRKFAAIACRTPADTSFAGGTRRQFFSI